MSYRELGPGAGYYLIAFDKDGNERQDDPDGLMSARLIDALGSGTYTDVFLASHGWKGDVPAAIDQYDRWFGALLALGDDLAAAKARRAGFKPLLIGLHWPSLPFGDEEFGDGAFAAADLPAIDLVESYVQKLGDTPEIRECLTIIADAVKNQAGALQLSPEVAQAYLRLNDALGLGSGDLDSPPDADRASFDPDEALGTARAASFGIGNVLGNLPLLILRQLSFWAMKKRGRMIGETAFHPLLRKLMDAGAAPPDHTRFHLMGHSFGCVAISSMICGPQGKGRLPRGVDSVMLVQGALSLWSYSPAIALAGGKPGYYALLLDGGRVAGPLAVTRSIHDTAVGKLYPLASKVKGSVDFAPKTLPRFGGLGAFGAQGLAPDQAGGQTGPEGAIGTIAASYVFERGKLHNLDGSSVIRKGGGLSGAHNDIDGPEVAHLWWELARNAG
ncbi:hypothetical protein SAMN05518801_107214 [Novosphingobium sp. CF614]|uniref:hypothetical protein n=1 Tax=Novosphingobium sp. CF614 TaxID=1884364 RepID=UPI0008E19E5B|nr:hypothetical protein [Novosphingobium sp. CF614]SFG11700.1 hypothetical protein SAMN05518801_107214 [Novosphingobium sp. CF614]